MSIIRQDYGAIGADVQTQMLIAPVLPAMVSDRAYVVGEQFIVNSVLYKITQAVSAAGVALVVDTNCAVSDTISQQIYKLAEEENINDASLKLPSSIKQYPTITNATNYMTNSTFYYKKGYTVFVNISVTNLTPNSEKVIFVLPEGYRPSSPNVHVRAKGQGASTPTDIEVSYTGNVYVRTTTSIMSLASFSFDALN